MQQIPKHRTHAHKGIHRSHSILGKKIFKGLKIKKSKTGVRKSLGLHPQNNQPGKHCDSFLYILLDIHHEHTGKNYDVVSMSSFFFNTKGTM